MTEQSEVEELKPCFVCGKKKSLICHQVQDDEPHIECTSCGASAPMRTWNTRPSKPEPNRASIDAAILRENDRQQELLKPEPMVIDRKELWKTMAQAYCTGENSTKVLDPILLSAIGELIIAKFRPAGVVSLEEILYVLCGLRKATTESEETIIEHWKPMAQAVLDLLAEKAGK